ncbi:NB-ARC domain-containing protein [Corchorus capsularis]|uniref:NB-ARC domain-containing protein n=1 Tax=Corchorus capsularis TaxID=210143 RepID=A0A1R3G476_COCAP|nr:NB-ARC domain-containing protein [Corchorus capsularis]
MAETAVSFLLGKLGPFLVEQARTLRGVEAKAQWIKDELERINAFLRVADENAETNPQLKVWVKQVRDIAYDIEDALDVFELRMARTQGDGFYGFIRKISCTIKNAKYLHQLASSIQGIESRVKDVAEGQKRYNSILHNSRQSSAATRNIWHERRADALWVKEAELVGIDKHRKQLIQWLVEESNPKFQVISVVGMGGLGKSTLAKKVFDADQVKKHFQIHVWGQCFRIIQS